MNKLWIVLPLIICVLPGRGQAQNIYTILHLNEPVDYKARRPQKIIERDKFYHGPDTPDFEKIIKTYDTAGMLTRVEYYNRNGDLTSRRRLANDTLRRLVLTDTTERWTSLGYQEETAQYAYDSSNHLTDVVNRDEYGKTIDSYIVSNDDQGNPTEMTGYGPGGEVLGRQTGEYRYTINRVYVHVYSADGRLVSTDTLKIGLRDAYLHPGRGEQYNEQGDIIQSIRVRRDGAADAYHSEYTYDPFGNCTDEKIYRVTQTDNGRLRLHLEQEFKRVYIY